MKRKRRYEEMRRLYDHREQYEVTVAEGRPLLGIRIRDGVEEYLMGMRVSVITVTNPEFSRSWEEARN